jgi:aspartate dehydrogenase
MDIGVIGAGAITHFLLEELNERQYERLRMKSIYVRNKEKYLELELKYGITLYTDLELFLDSGIDIVVEAASVEAVKSMLPTVIKQKDTVLISVGALADETIFTEMSNLADEHNHRIYLPSGAVGGLDLIQNANALGAISNVSLTTRKPAYTLIEEDITEEKIVFEGKAADAIEQFPRNVNVSIVLSLAGIGTEKTTMCLIADPNIDKNIHKIEVSGDFGHATFTVTNNALPANPKTSYLAAMSILGTLKREKGNIKIGG